MPSKHIPKSCFEVEGKLFCKHTKKRCFETYDRAKSAMTLQRKHVYKDGQRKKTSRKKICERCYKCEACQYWHLTSMLEKEFSERY